MPGLPIAIEVSPPDAPREYVTVLLAACARASAEADCVPASEVSAQGSRAVAIVTWQGSRRVIVEVGLRKNGRPEWRTRALDFERADDGLERWRAIGLVVGTLSRPEVELSEPVTAPPPEVEAKLAPESQAPPTAAAEPEVDVTPKPQPPAAAAPRKSPRVTGRATRRSTGADAIGERRGFDVALDLGGVVGPGLEGVRSGALARARLRWLEHLAATFAVRYLERPIGDGSFGGRWITGAAGLSAVLGGGESLQFAAGLDARAEYFHGRADDGQDSDGRGRWLSGVGAGLNGGWMPTRSIGLFLGADAAWMFGETDVSVGDEWVATDEPLRVAVEAGLRVQLW